DSTVSVLFSKNNTLYAGGLFTNSIASFNGSVWTPLGTGANGNIKTLTYYNNQLVAGGSFDTISGASIANIAIWNGVSWDSLASGFDGEVNILLEDSINNLLYVAGDFNNSGSINVNKIAVWDGVSWSNLSSGMDYNVNALAIYNNELYAAGDFDGAGGIAAYHIAKWNGTNWSAVGSGSNLEVNDLQVFQGELYAAGKFTNMGGAAKRIAKWNGSNWSSVANGFNAEVLDLEIFNNELYAAGLFSISNLDTVGNIAKLVGSVWMEVSSERMDSTVITLSANSSFIYAGGLFSSAGGVPLNHVAQSDLISSVTAIEGGNKNDFFTIYPNPSNGNTTLNYFLEKQEKVEILLYNIHGQLVKSYKEGIKNKGINKFVFSTNKIKQGIYFVKLRNETSEKSIKLTVLK
ncbi:MAG: T9SS type A sorting domain-containing protein, partial [Vicingaceae bacterium]|nr:T9SS type A sorting domain-containing protein [Vicingaceae bacterium]